MDARRKVDLLLDNIRSLYNVGSIFRTADGAGVRHLYLCGITATPENQRLAKTGLGAERSVTWSYHPDAVRLGEELLGAGNRLWALENRSDGLSLFSERLHDDRALVLVLGNEIVGVDPGLLSLCERVLHIPMLGAKLSLNVATAAGIGAYALIHGKSR